VLSCYIVTILVSDFFQVYPLNFYVILSSAACVLHARTLCFIAPVIFGEQHKEGRAIFTHSTSLSLSTLFSNTLNLYSSLSNFTPILYTVYIKLYTHTVYCIYQTSHPYCILYISNFTPILYTVYIKLHTHTVYCIYQASHPYCILYISNFTPILYTVYIKLHTHTVYCIYGKIAGFVF